MRQGPANQLIEYSQALLDSAGHDPEAVNKALSLGMLFWNLAVCGNEAIEEELPKMEKELCKDEKDRRAFRAIAGMMLERYEKMFGSIEN